MLKIAVAQLNPIVGDLAGNAQQILAATTTAAAQGAELLLTPELAICGYPPRDLLMDPGLIQAMGQQVAQLARQLPQGLTALVGTVVPNPRSPACGEKPLFNSIACLAQGQVQQIFHKRLLPTYDVFDEDRYFQPGAEPNILTLGGLRLGITVCEDVWNDEEFWGRRHYAIDPVADLAQAGVDLVLNLSASPFYLGKQQLREAMLSHSARRHQQPLIYLNQVGGNDELIFDGRSLAFNRRGERVGRGRAFSPDLMLLNFDPMQQDLLPGAIAPQPETEAAETWAALVLGVRDYARKCGFNRAVIGLSGGIDSSLVAAIATAALGPAQVLGVLMPSPYSSDHSLRDALQLAENLGISTQILKIGPLMQAYDQTLGAVFAGTDPGIAEENLQARIRGNLLMAISNKFGHLLISTGNKSEMAVGYCTLYGDMNGGLAAIADLPKTRVYALCRWLNSDLSRDRAALSSDYWANFLQSLPTKAIAPQSQLIPETVLTKAPSAELKPGQVDQDSLPPLRPARRNSGTIYQPPSGDRRDCGGRSRPPDGAASRSDGAAGRI